MIKINKNRYNLLKGKGNLKENTYNIKLYNLIINICIIYMNNHFSYYINYIN